MKFDKYCREKTDAQKSDASSEIIFLHYMTVHNRGLQFTTFVLKTHVELLHTYTSVEL